MSLPFFNFSGSEKESAAAWLAAATKRQSPQMRRKSGAPLNGMIHFADDSTQSADRSTLSTCGSQLTKKSSYPFAPVLTINSSSSPSQYAQPAAAATSVQAPVVTTTTFYSGTDSSTAEYKIPAITTTTSSVNSSSPPTWEASSAVEKRKLLQPFGKNDRVRRTSILRPPSTFVPSPAAAAACSKKKVSFADTAGKQLEVVRYFAITPTVATRRYSSYTAPTAAYLNNGNYNSPWNFAISGNAGNGGSRQLGTALNNGASQTTTPAPTFYSNNSPKSPNYNYEAASRLAPRYELVACNFASPSLALSFAQRLEGQSVLLHSVTTAETTVYGTVSVVNLHFTKKVVVRYTFNEWATYVEREATYMLGSHDGRTDKFSFVIYARPEDFGAQKNNLATAFTAYSQANTFVASSDESSNSTHPRLYFALCFTTGDGRTFWDNNDGRNYCLNLTAY